ncbi:DUF3040 domain-containing protein [Streptomyces sp. So13.3]|nr:DUF3040 domain-containing protein [Streptomyces sp. So13.3]
MDGLTEQERRALEELESDLCQDRRLHRRVRRLEGRSRSAWWQLVVLLTLVTASVSLAVAGIHTPTPAILWAFAGAWTATLVNGAWLLMAWTRRPRLPDAGR